MVSHSPAKFGGQRYCSGADIPFLDCQVISQDHVVKSCDFIVGKQSW